MINPISFVIIFLFCTINACDIPDIPKIISPELVRAKKYGLHKAVETVSQFSGARLRHRMNVEAIAFSPDGTRIATSQLYGDTFIFDTRTCKPIQTISSWTGRAIAWSLDGIRLAICSGHDVCIVDTKTGKLIQRLQNGCYIRAFSWSPDNTQIATIDSDCKARIFDAQTGAIIHTFNCVLSTGDHCATQSYINKIIWSPDGTLLATMGRNKYNLKDEVCLLDPKACKPIQHFLESRSIKFCTRSSDGKQIAVLCDRKKIRIIEWHKLCNPSLKNTDFEYEINGSYNWEELYDARFDWSGTQLALLDSRHSITLYEFNAEEKTWRLKHTYYLGYAQSLSWSPRGNHIIASHCYEIHLLDIQKETISSITRYGNNDEVAWSGGTQFAKQCGSVAQIFDLEEFEQITDTVNKKLTLAQAELLDALALTAEDRRHSFATHHARIHASEEHWKTWKKLKKIIPQNIARRLSRFIVRGDVSPDGYETPEEYEK